MVAKPFRYADDHTSNATAGFNNLDKTFLDVCIDFMGGQNYAFLGVKPSKIRV